jgi:hypothetical protein
MFFSTPKTKQLKSAIGSFVSLGMVVILSGLLAHLFLQAILFFLPQNPLIHSEWNVKNGSVYAPPNHSPTAGKASSCLPSEPSQSKGNVQQPCRD